MANAVLDLMRDGSNAVLASQTEPLSGSAVTLTLSGIVSAEAFGTHAVTRVSLASVALSGVTTSEAFGTLFVSTGAAAATSITLSGLASAEVFGTPAVSTSSFSNVSLTGIGSGETFGSLYVAANGVRTLTEQDIRDLVEAFWAHPKALTFSKFIASR